MYTIHLNDPIPLEFTNAPVPAGQLRYVIPMSRRKGLDTFIISILHSYTYGCFGSVILTVIFLLRYTYSYDPAPYTYGYVPAPYTYGYVSPPLNIRYCSYTVKHKLLFLHC